MHCAQVLCRAGQALRVTHDHRPTDEEEKKCADNIYNYIDYTDF